MKIALLTLIAATGLAAQSIDLSGQWKRHDGDDPAYAQPGFDDSGWSTYELPRGGPMPKGVFWLRRTVVIPAGLADPVLTVGTMSPCYGVFVNRTRIGENACHADATPFFGPRAFPLPAGIAGPGGPMTVALRIEG